MHVFPSIYLPSGMPGKYYFEVYYFGVMKRERGGYHILFLLILLYVHGARMSTTAVIVINCVP